LFKINLIEPFILFINHNIIMDLLTLRNIP
jgi:hypothetical protein